MKHVNLMKQTTEINEPDEDPFEYLVEHIDEPSQEDDSDTVHRLEISSLPES